MLANKPPHKLTLKRSLLQGTHCFPNSYLTCRLGGGGRESIPDRVEKMQDTHSYGRGCLGREEGKFSLGFSPLLSIDGVER